MTWEEFNTAVRVHLTIHNRRQGVQTLIDQLIKAALTDLQSTIVALRTGHTTVYAPSRFTTDGYAGKGRFSPGIVITQAYARDPEDSSDMYEFTPVHTPQEERAMIEGWTALGDRLISIRANRGEFLVVPNPVVDTSEVVLVWDGAKTDFCESDDVPDSWSAEPSATLPMIVADFVQARLVRQVDNDLVLAQSFAASYAGGKRRLKSDWNEVAILPGRNKRA